MRLKRSIDILISVFMLALGLPFFLVIAVAIVTDSGFPVLFRQRRVGLGFRQFQLIKFRSMVVSSGGPLITSSGDKRVTRVGRFLRATKLDEFPQLWNVLLGDMSLVGPRPELPQYVEMFHDRYTHVLTVRPGITDLASIRFRNEENLLSKSPDPLREYADNVLRVKLDLADEYIRKRSFWLDLQILIKTVVVVVQAQ